MDSACDDTRLRVPGCPIRKPPDQSLLGSSPELFAARCVLHRWLAPRHSPCALSSLTILRRSRTTKTAQTERYLLFSCQRPDRNPAPVRRLSRSETLRADLPPLLPWRQISRLLGTAHRNHPRILVPLPQPRHQMVMRWWSGPGSNRQPPACKADALPVELPPRSERKALVGLGRVELPTSPLSGARSNQLSYRPAVGAHARRTRPASGRQPAKATFRPPGSTVDAGRQCPIC